MALGYRELIGSIGPEHLYRFDVRRFYTLFLRRRSKYMARILTIDVSISSFVSYDSHIEGSEFPIYGGTDRPYPSNDRLRWAVKFGSQRGLPKTIFHTFDPFFCIKR